MVIGTVAVLMLAIRSLASAALAPLVFRLAGGLRVQMLAGYGVPD